MNIVPMDTMSGGREDLIEPDITIRITIEILGNGLCHMESITVLGVAARAALMRMTPAMNLGPGNSLHCPAWYTGISTGMISHGRYEAGGRSGITSIAEAGHHIRPSQGPSHPRGWPVKPQDPPGPRVAAGLRAGRQAAILSAAAAVPAVTGRCPPHPPKWQALARAWLMTPRGTGDAGHPSPPLTKIC